MARRLVTHFTVHRTLAFWVIFFLTFAVRFPLLLHFRAEILTIGEEPRIAYALASKGQFADPYVVPTGPTAHSTPFFPVLLAGIYKVLGFGFAGQFGRCLLIISGYSLLFALYPTFAVLFGFPLESGLLAGFISALLPVRRSFEVFRGWEEPWAAMALAFLLFITLKRNNSPRPESKSAAWLGVCWGVALYISFSLASILVGLLFVDLVTNRTLRSLRDVCITLIATLAVITPWTLRNHQQLHGWTLMRSNLGLELRYGNHDHARPSSDLNYFLDPSSSRMHPGLNVSEAMLVRDLGEINYMRRDLHLALRWIFDHPRNFAWLTLERFAFFWLGPLNHLYETLVVSSYTLLGFAGLGFVSKQVGQIQFRLWCTVFVFFPLMYYVVPFAHRYRVPIDWMIWLSAGLCVSVLLENKLRFQHSQDHDRVISCFEEVASKGCSRPLSSERSHNQPVTLSRTPITSIREGR
jgi:hypothetical protein